jgi:malate dehydrogenase (oxaloacetate-decarboxylating)
VGRPIILPLSNPTARSEATPQDLLTWTDGRALVGTGSPFPPVQRDGRALKIDQTNNAYVYPGVGLGVIVAKARRVSDGMFLSAARAFADLSPAKRDPSAPLLPPLVELPTISQRVALAVAQKAQTDALAEPCREEALVAAIKAKSWQPLYAAYRRLRSDSGERDV